MKYIKILEQFIAEAKKFKAGDKWSKDFDYQGMLAAGLKVDVNTPIKKLNKLYDSFTDVNYHTIAKGLGIAIDWIEDNDKKGANDYMDQFHKAVQDELKVNEGINLKASHLSSEDYQKAKKLKAFDSTDWVWNPKSNLYDKVSESVDEASRGKVHKAVKKGSYPVTLVVISNGMVVKQKLVDTPEAVPAHFNTLQKEYPNANISVEDNTGKRLFSESVNEADKYVDARGNFKLRNGLEVKIKPASEIKNLNISKDYMKYNLQIAGKTVKIEKAFKGVFGGAPSEFTVKGYEAFETRSTGKPRVGFTQSIIGDVVSESVTEGLSSSDIRKATETIKKHVKKLGKRANGTSDQVAINISKILGWSGSKIDQLDDYLRKINGGSEEIIFESVNEGSRRDPESIRKEYEELKKHSMMALVSAWSRINKVGNPKSLDKEGLISDLLRAKHGNTYVDKAFESVNEGGTIANQAYSFADYFGVPVSLFKGFKFDGTDDIDKLHGLLKGKSSSLKGTENIYNASLKESVTEAREFKGPFNKNVIQALIDKFDKDLKFKGKDGKIYGVSSRFLDNNKDFFVDNDGYEDVMQYRDIKSAMVESKVNKSNIPNFENFNINEAKIIKDYMSAISIKDFKNIKKGDEVKYMGGTYTVTRNNGYTITLQGSEKHDKAFDVNYSMFNHGGMIIEGKSYQEKFKEESDYYQEMINDPSKRVYDIVDFAQFTTGGMTQKQWEMFMYGRYKKDLQSRDTKIKEKMYKVLNKWLGESITESSSKDGGDKSNGKSHHADHTNKSIAQHWKDTYGEEFHSKYPAIAKIVKSRPGIDRRELKRIWDETYGENFEEQYPALWQKLD